MRQYDTPACGRGSRGPAWGAGGRAAVGHVPPAFGRKHLLRGWMAKTGGAACFFLLALQPPLALWRAPAATITNYLSRNGVQSWLNINVGDTVVWVNQQPSFLGTNFVESYSGEWSSPAMVNVGDSFSFTFTNAGFYAYRTGVSGYGGTKGLPGTVTVNGWTGAPPAVTILTPLDGSFFPPTRSRWCRHGRRTWTISPRCSILPVRTSSASEPPEPASRFRPRMRRRGPNLPQGQYALVAKAIEQRRRGHFVTARQHHNRPRLSGLGRQKAAHGRNAVLLRRHPRGEHVGLWLRRRVADTHCAWGLRQKPGVFVDESVRGAPVSSRFYQMGFGR